ncbi:oligosaccharide flippase family protein [Halorussus marinus]|uniref:oligosaccharide flippase family protein n=1 Tax=Halorussus marinus TaxID=2505976 RepID=UPI00106DDC83|nr:oligosaccharide flippase family protein [Halorussus marinus]
MSDDDNTADLSLGRETAVAMFAKFALSATGFIGIVIFANVLDNEGLGKYYFLLALAKVSVQIPGGFANAIRKRVSEVGVDPSEYFGFGLLVHSVFTGVTLALVVVSYPFIQDRVGPFAFAVATVAIVGTLGLFSLVNRVYSGIGHPGASFWTDTVRSVITLGLQVVFLIVGFRVLGMMGGLIIANVLTAVLVLMLMRVRPRIPATETVRRVTTFAKWSVPNSLFQNLYMRLDVLILGFVVGNAAVGLYEPALRLTVPAAIIAGSIGDSLTVKASGLNSIDHSVSEDLRNALSYTCLFAIPILFGAAAIPTELMTVIFGTEARPGWTALVGLAVFQVFNTYRLPFDNVISGMNRPDLRFRVSLFTLAVNAPLAIVLGFEYGLIGVVIATIIAEVIRVLTYLGIAYRLFGQLMLPWQLVEQTSAGLVMFGVVVALSEAVAITGWVSLVAVVGAGAVTYFAVLVVVSSHFRVTVRNVLADLGITRAVGL